MMPLKVISNLISIIELKNAIQRSIDSRNEIESGLEIEIGLEIDVKNQGNPIFKSALNPIQCYQQFSLNQSKNGYEAKRKNMKMSVEGFNLSSGI